MNELTIDVTEWLGGTSDLDDLTFGSFVIRGGTPALSLTEVQDLIANATRETIRVPAIRVTRWLLAHWWRLRWESERREGSWRSVHSMAALGGGMAWPNLDVVSDGEFVQLTVRAELRPDVAAVRYLRDMTIEIPASAFERAVDRFIDKIEARVTDCFPADHTLRDLRAELREEREDAVLARQYRLEARAGFDAGDAPPDWYEAVKRVASEAGDIAIEDVLAARMGGQGAADAVAALKRAPTTVDLSSIPSTPPDGRGNKPWQRGAEAGRRVRTTLGIGDGPVTDEKLTEALGANLSTLQVDTAPDASILGGYRSHASGVTQVLIPTARRTSQRFYFARLMGMASLYPRSEQVLPITGAATAAQKFARSFASEFLCPWEELREFAARHGTEEEAISRAAEMYRVSDMMITTSLVNHHALDRVRLATYAS